MTIGYLGGETCFLTQAEAVAAYWGSQPVSLVSTSTTNKVILTQPVYSGGSWYLQGKSCVAAAGTSATCDPSFTASLAAFTPVSCTMVEASGSAAAGDPSQDFIDGNLLGWGVVAAMVAAWGVMVLRRGM
jgi:hypothetical protein